MIRRMSLAPRKKVIYMKAWSTTSPIVPLLLPRLRETMSPPFLMASPRWRRAFLSYPLTIICSWAPLCLRLFLHWTCPLSNLATSKCLGSLLVMRPLECRYRILSAYLTTFAKSSLLHSQPKYTVGTPAYIAPEVLLKKEYDGKIFEDGTNESSKGSTLMSPWAQDRNYLVFPINGVLKYHCLGNQERNDSSVTFENYGYCFHILAIMCVFDD